MGGQVDIRRLGVADAGEMLTLQRAAYVSEARLHDDLDLPALTQTMAELEAELSEESVTAWGIRDGGRLVAAMRIRARRNVAEVGRVTVVPDRQGGSLGSSLLRIVDTVADDDVDRIELFTGSKSAANIRLYRRLGFAECRRESIGPYDLVFLTRPRIPAD
ncbi:GNAT family N-acetyltransferase [Gordonia sp. ABSL1-1]|uniref:GNAT family N-acetyltransferase n=1 Tax=Gordonia sp. ABSL1-1 TaxID=3053923 RepID=UPI002573707C|nr:GNAT family N-acetyltransferase [Gordonia sp. ABSL1-1]MDL9935726.1 GNAT family N-acetyltransferase [Gordonia sp. ABSL1-1]